MIKHKKDKLDEGLLILQNLYAHITLDKRALGSWWRVGSPFCTAATPAGLSTDKSNFWGSAKTTLRTANQVFHIYTGEPPSIFVRHRKNLGCVLPTHFTGINRAIRSSLHQCHACRLNSLKLFLKECWKKKNSCQNILQLANIPAGLRKRRPHRRHRY